MRAYCSLTYFCSAYGFSGFGVIVSTSGIVRLLAVHRRRSRVHDAPNFMIARRDQHVQRPDHVGHVRLDRLRNRKRNPRLRRDVEHRIDTFERIGNRRRIADVCFNDLGRAVHTLAPPGGKVVDRPHAQSCGNERVNEMRSDEARAARHQHESRLRLRIGAH